MGCFPDTPFLWQTQKVENTSLLSLEKVVYFACVINCAGQLICLCASLLSLTSLHLKVKFNKTIILSWLLSYLKQVKVLFPIEKTKLISIMTYSKLRPSLSLCLFYGPWLRYILNQSESAKETVSPKIDKNIQMLVCFICMLTEERILIDIFIVYLLFIIIYSSFLVGKLKYIIHVMQKI